jgi:hypothetical protein
MPSPILTARDFFTVVVKPDADDAAQNSHDVRHVMHAIIFLHQMDNWHINENSIEYLSRTLFNNAFRARCDALYSECPLLDRMRGLATNVKHCTPYSAPQATFGTGATNADSPLRLTSIAKGKLGRSENLLSIIGEAPAFWRAEIEALNTESELSQRRNP